MNIRPYYKAAVAVIGSVLTLGTFLLSMQGVLPESVSSVVAGILAVLTPLSVWMVRNQPAVEELAEIVEDTVGAFQKRGG